jgi:hypothetical protein
MKPEETQVFITYRLEQSEQIWSKAVHFVESIRTHLSEG